MIAQLSAMHWFLILLSSGCAPSAPCEPGYAVTYYDTQDQCRQGASGYAQQLGIPIERAICVTWWPVNIGG
jgi:hypothetical protein